MNILYINNGVQDVPSKGEYLLNAAKRLGLECVKPISDNYMCPNPPEYVLNVQPYARCFRMGTRWTACWEIDCLVNREQMQWYWKFMDTIFLANRVKWLEVPDKVIYLLQACDPALYDFDVKQEYDLVQIGSMKDLAYWKDHEIHEKELSTIPENKYDIYKLRRRLFRKLRERYNVLNFKYKERLSVHDYLEILSRGKIQLISSMKVLGEREIAQRFFESLPIGPVLTNYAPDLDYLDLIPNVDYFVYHNQKEMFKKIDELLNDEYLRKRVAENGKRKAMESHTYEHRLRSILDYLIKNHGFKK